MGFVDLRQAAEAAEAALPLLILLARSDPERAFLLETYHQYKALMYKIASTYFHGRPAEIDDAVCDAVERMCRYCKNFMAVPCNKRAAYIVKLVENVCRSRLRALALQDNKHAFSLDDGQHEPLPAAGDDDAVIFDHMFAADLLNAFDSLSSRDRELIRMRHVDCMSYEEMSAAVHMSVGAIRTALTRAKKRMRQQGLPGKDGYE